MLRKPPVCALTVWVCRTALLDLQGRKVLQLQAARREVVSCGKCAQQGLKPVTADIGAEYLAQQEAGLRRAPHATQTQLLVGSLRVL